MKTITKITLAFGAAALLMAGSLYAASTVTPSISEESLGLRKTSLSKESDTVASKTSYATDTAGTSTKIKRAFQDAPPMIPHDVEGMLPITINDNQCVSCHMPEVAADMGATPIPASHFTDFRPHPTYDGKEFKLPADTMKNDISIKKLDALAGARFNCSQCHAPQSDGQLVENNFQAQYTDKDGANKSTWSGSKLTDGLNTIIGGDSQVTANDLDNSDSKAGHLDGGGH
ncbi:nitrate reductase cytochrome c-type subunit [bacterium]|nr:nitrate reductase cytochrome c-type subunit [bacterium]MBU1435252.1 nitrate reductase cytochrome c-type subunit [bacterium]MBU1502893.1 nitrate reductase cytochrome c-type subunit [bacterium]